MQIEIIEEFRKGLTEIKDGVANTEKHVTSLTMAVEKLQKENERLEAEFNKPTGCDYLCSGRPRNQRAGVRRRWKSLDQRWSYGSRQSVEDNRRWSQLYAPEPD